jgi:hypothetical protein
MLLEDLPIPRDARAVTLAASCRILSAQLSDLSVANHLLLNHLELSLTIRTVARRGIYLMTQILKFPRPCRDHTGLTQRLRYIAANQIPHKLNTLRYRPVRLLRHHVRYLNLSVELL